MVKSPLFMVSVSVIIAIDDMVGADLKRANVEDVALIPQILNEHGHLFAVFCIKMMKSALFDVVCHSDY